MTQHQHHRYKNESQDARRHDEQQAVHPEEPKKTKKSFKEKKK